MAAGAAPSEKTGSSRICLPEDCEFDMLPAHAPGPVRDSLASAPCGRRRRSKYSSVCALTHAHATGMCVHDSSPVGQKDKPHGCGACLFGDPYGTRTHVTAVKGRCLNHLTNGPYEKGAGDRSAPFFGSGTWIRTGDTSGMNRMLWPTELCRHILPKQH